MRTVDKFLLSIPNKYQDEILLSNGLKLYADVSFKPEWYATSKATVVVVPDGANNVKEGDEVFISYSIIAERTWGDNAHSFFPVSVDEKNPYIEIWKNNKDEWLRKVAIPLPTRKIIWVVTLLDRYQNFIEGCEGSQSDAERFMAQFSFQDSGKYKHKNLIQTEKENLWKANIFDIFALRKEDGSIQSISDRVIMQPVMEDYTERYRIQGLLEHPNDTVKGMYTDRGVVVSGGEKIGLQKGDIAGFEPRFCEKYTLDNQEYFLVKESRIDLLWQS